MSPLVAEQLENQLESEGSLTLSESEIAGLFDYRARRLVGLSGVEALDKIRSGGVVDSPEWDELAHFAALMLR
jgi:hypothetical protein